MTVVIETNGLGKQYGRQWALRDCTLSIPEGKVVGLVGPNGAGKTTLLSLAVGLLTPTRGSITVLAGRPGWWSSKFDSVNADPFNSLRFGVRDVVPIGYAAFAFALGSPPGCSSAGCCPRC